MSANHSNSAPNGFNRPRTAAGSRNPWATVASYALLSLTLGLVAPAPSMAAPVNANDNTRPSGQLEGDVLRVRLVADVGRWSPEGPQAASHEVGAFGEEGGPLSTPGPLIRVREGTTVVLTLRNALGAPLQVNGFCTRPGPCEAVSVAPGASREVRFTLNAPGTYPYWAATGAESLRERRARDTQLGGVIVVDPREGAQTDRIFVLGAFGDPPRHHQTRSSPSDIFTINGLSWPHTEKLRYDIGDRVRWRVVNLSFTPHPMHLHGHHFTVEAAGDISTERRLASDEQHQAVTELVAPGRTATISWTPERPGNWLFHCHMTFHMHPAASAGHAGHGAGDSAAGMSGMVFGIHVGGTGASQAPSGQTPRRFSLILREEPNRYGKNKKGFRMDLEGVDAPRLNSGPVPGPVIALTRGEPVEITIVNRMSEPTGIHWHGMELESYFDGVPGWGGQGSRLAPPIAPGKSFVAKFTPPRAGTFMYHTHWHNDAQLTGGLYGPLLVLEPGERYDPATDHIVVVGHNGVVQEDQWAARFTTFNGSATPDPIVMRAGVPNRLRLINITMNAVTLLSLVGGFPSEQVMWKPLAKDAATLPAGQTAPRPARQLVAVGETYDFEVQPSRSQPLWLELRRPDGAWLVQAPITAR
jgi:FtsP/CotA-like multicopper oxidase with cupredoxin domain